MHKYTFFMLFMFLGLSRCRQVHTSSSSDKKRSIFRRLSLRTPKKKKNNDGGMLKEFFKEVGVSWKEFLICLGIFVPLVVFMGITHTILVLLTSMLAPLFKKPSYKISSPSPFISIVAIFFLIICWVFSSEKASQVMSTDKKRRRESGDAYLSFCVFILPLIMCCSLLDIGYHYYTIPKSQRLDISSAPDANLKITNTPQGIILHEESQSADTIANELQAHQTVGAKGRCPSCKQQKPVKDILRVSHTKLDNSVCLKTHDGYCRSCLRHAGHRQRVTFRGPCGEKSCKYPYVLNGHKLSRKACIAVVARSIPLDRFKLVNTPQGIILYDKSQDLATIQEQLKNEQHQSYRGHCSICNESKPIKDILRISHDTSIKDILRIIPDIPDDFIDLDDEVTYKACLGAQRGYCRTCLTNGVNRQDVLENGPCCQRTCTYPYNLGKKLLQQETFEAIVTNFTSLLKNKNN